jgi:SAM-dependent methyltransferase
MGHAYGEVFYDYIDRGAHSSARRILPVLLDELPIRSVLDVGCGRGAWLAEWMLAGVNDVFGVDGGHVDPRRLEIPKERFRALDVGRPFDLERRFDVVQCLEVGEHLPAADARTLVENLVRHGAIILYSAAVPGQGGESHVNERPPSFWRSLFRSSGYSPFDCVRPAVAGLRSVEPWYRYNTILYVREDLQASLPEVITAHRIDDAEPIPNCAPRSWRLRCAVLGLLPAHAITRLAVLKHRAFVLSRL